MRSQQEFEEARLRNRHMWQCHWHYPDQSCDDFGKMVVTRQETVLHVAHEFVFRIYYSDMSCDDPIRQGEGIVCVHDYNDDIFLVQVEWQLEEKLQGRSKLLEVPRQPQQIKGQGTLWDDVEDRTPSPLELTDLDWSSLTVDGIIQSRHRLL